MTTADDAPSAARDVAASATPSARFNARSITFWAFLAAGVLYVLWLADNLRTDNAVPTAQLNAAILTVMSVGALTLRPQPEPAAVVQLTAEVRTLSARVGELEHRDAEMAERLEVMGQRLVVLDEWAHRMGRCVDAIVSSPAVIRALHPTGSRQPRGRAPRSRPRSGPAPTGEPPTIGTRLAEEFAAYLQEREGDPGDGDGPR
jgi:hypothetical protein